MAVSCLYSDRSGPAVNTMHSPLLCGYLSALLDGPPESQSELGTVGGVASLS